MKDNEIIPIDENKTYGITKEGKIWSFPLLDDKYNNHNGRWIKTSKDKDGYEIVHLSRLEGKKNQRVHRLVALAFISNGDNKPQVNHIDGNKSNNNVSNLEWATRKQNASHAIATKLSARGKKQKRNTSGYIGVVKNYSKWAAYITVDSKVVYIGAFYTKIEAAKAYDEASLKHHGNTGNLNFSKGENHE